MQIALAATHVSFTMDRIIADVRSKFVAQREKIVQCSVPWTPWALIELLDIDDSQQTIPAELILYKALVHKTRLKIHSVDEVVQVRVCVAICTCKQIHNFTHIFQEEFIQVTAGDTLYFRDGRKYQGLHRRYVMAHVGSNTQISAVKLWDFVKSFKNNEIGILLHYERTGGRSISRRMKRLISNIRANFGHILVDIPG